MGSQEGGARGTQGGGGQAVSSGNVRVGYQENLIERVIQLYPVPGMCCVAGPAGPLLGPIPVSDAT